MTTPRSARLFGARQLAGADGVGSKYALVGPIRGGFIHQAQKLLVFGNDGKFRLPSSGRR
jgi:hypothetical protein